MLKKTVSSKSSHSSSFTGQEAFRNLGPHLVRFFPVKIGSTLTSWFKNQVLVVPKVQLCKRRFILEYHMVFFKLVKMTNRRSFIFIYYESNYIFLFHTNIVTFLVEDVSHLCHLRNHFGISQKMEICI